MKAKRIHMILKMLVLAVAFTGGLTTPLFADTQRGDHLITESGGAQGIAGAVGPNGAPGIAGAAGSQGIQGIPGIPGAPGILSFADFYALQGGSFNDNPAPIANGVAVNFPNTGSTTTGIARATSSSFTLSVIGTYLVLFQFDGVSAGQLALRLNGGPFIPDSVVGRATGTSQLTGISLVTTTTTGSVLEVINPGNISLVAAPFDNVVGSTHAGSAHLVIIRIL
jgi:hypothetical protein